MTDLGDGHVRFRNPPAIETLQGVFFRQLPKFSAAHQGWLWAKYFQSEFPIVQEKHPLEHVDERFDESVFSVSDVRWKVSERPDTPRIWAQSRDGNHVVQIQRDAIVTNWLKPQSDDQFKDFKSRRADFDEKLRNISQFLNDEGIGDLEPTSCLMTYVNHIPVDSISSVPATAADVFTFWTNSTTEQWLPNPDRLNISVSYPMCEKRGRLHINVIPAIHRKSDGDEPVLRFELTARGRPEQNSLNSALAWLDMGHEWIVRGFVDITRQVWHAKDKWERIS